MEYVDLKSNLIREDNKGKPLDFTDLAIRSLGESERHNYWALAQLFINFDNDLEWADEENGRNIITHLSDNEIRVLKEKAPEFMIRPADLAILFVGREAIHWIKERGGEFDWMEDVEKEIEDIKISIVDSLILRIAKEYGVYGSLNTDALFEKVDEDGKVEGLDVNSHWFASKYTLKVMNEYFRQRIFSNNNEFILGDEGRKLALEGLEKIHNLFEHEDWDETLESLIEIVKNPLSFERDNRSFEAILDQAHATDMVLGTIADSNEQEDCRFLIAVRNSRRYGMAKCWHYLPIRLKEKLGRETGGVFDMGEAMGKMEIEQCIPSIMKPDSFSAKYMLAEAVLTMERNEELKERLKQGLLKEKLDMRLDMSSARSFYKHSGGKLTRELDL